MDLPDKTVPVQGTVPKKQIQAVVSGAKKVERPATRRFFDSLFAESPKNLAKKVGRDVVVPRIKQGFEQAFNEFLSGMLWGGDKTPANLVQGTVIRGGAQSYSNISTQNAMLAARQATQPSQNSGNYQDLTVPTQQYAEALLANMFDLLNQYRVVAVADLYELAGLGTSPSDNAYGWTSLEGSRISPRGGGYLLELPRPTLI